MALCASPVGIYLSSCSGSSASAQFRASQLQCLASKFQWDPLRVAHFRLLCGNNLLPANSCRRSAIFSSPLARPRMLHVVSSHERGSETAEEKPCMEAKQQKTVLERVTEAALACFDIVKKPAVVALVVGLLLTQIPDAWAASGGMMGGRAFSSGGSRSSGGYAGRTYSVPRSGFSFSAPYAAPSPFFGGGFGPSVYVAPAYGFGIGGGSSFLVLLLGFLAFFFISGFLTDRRESTLFTSTRKTSVLKLQVGLLGMARSLQQDLDRIAERADTSTPTGLHHILTETVLSLLRHPDFCISGYSSADLKRDSEAGEKLFNELSLEERAKFDEETIVNVNNIFRRGPSKPKSGFNNEYIVVTVLVAAEGAFKLPAINSNADLKEALRELGSIPKDQVLAVEVLWTPQDQNDTLSERELLRDYPLLRSL
ncbi:hypothetical protein GOP47_0017742 [Adiantum capillus-veneris]|uniref:Myelin-associated oligodendrocyte basic protein n=1 Tax=Adiantum capillus-veneris TaxID=13818 RepID=A0A9D4UGX8_ADICA|nr:hypothetical protein GOP47_0017742 [Adiantum capillus-veneris]